MKDVLNTYYLSERYLRKMYKDIVFNELITLVFYFVFNILFQNHPKYSMLKPMFGVVFMVIAVALLFLGKKRADKMASICYEVKKKGLRYFDGKAEHFYPWEEFVEVKKNPNLISRIFPYEFSTKSETFTLHRQLEKPDELIPEILKMTHLEAK